VRDFLEKNDPEEEKFRCLVTMFGIPLRVLPPKLTAQEEKESVEIQTQYDSVTVKIESAEGERDTQRLKGLREEQERIRKELRRAKKVFQGAAVDSELALVGERNYSLEGWLPNRLFLGYQGRPAGNMPQKVMMVSRLDGPSKEVVRRIIDDSLETESEGLKGKSYFDARWPYPEGKEVSSYALYDRAIHHAARLVEKSGKMPIVLDSQDKTFQPGECPDAALYCGWYSLAKYVDAFTWARGAVGYHIASSECSTLKAKGSQVWCKMMLEKGVAATLGPVAEPYVHAFPVPELFFGLLLEGRLTLAECYALSNPFWSWQMVLIGDPLYRPFKAAIK
jgi:uncharacterized protein (TIGR03790 family)